MAVSDLLKKMGRSVFFMEGDRTVDDAINALTANKVSALSSPKTPGLWGYLPNGMSCGPICGIRADRLPMSG